MLATLREPAAVAAITREQAAVNGSDDDEVGKAAFIALAIKGCRLRLKQQ